MALESVVNSIQDQIYGLAVRMLWHPADAEDASQEILIRIITNLGGYRGESAFMTWAYRVASNYLLTTRKRRAEREELTFDLFAQDLDTGPADTIDIAVDVERNLLIEEVRVGCTTGMLLCLDRPHRLAYILGEILEVTGPEGAEILQISPAAFRKRLSRARAAIESFMLRMCGIVNPDNPCRCARRVNRAVEVGRVDPQQLLFADHPRSDIAGIDLDGIISEVNQLRRSAFIYRRHPKYQSPETFLPAIR